MTNGRWTPRLESSTLVPITNPGSLFFDSSTFVGEALMHISGTSHAHGPHGINAPHALRRPSETQPAQPAQMPADRVEISPAAEAAMQAAESGAVRQDLVDRIRAEIAAGTYETSDKLNQAVDRLLDEIG
jgi:negative regulator of flagellin synthesis FlgM